MSSRLGQLKDEGKCSPERRVATDVERIRQLLGLRIAARVRGEELGLTQAEESPMAGSVDLPDVVSRWNDFLERTFLLREEATRLRQETQGAGEVRRGLFSTLHKIEGYISILEAGLRKAMDDVKRHHLRDEAQRPTGEEWLKHIDGLLGPEPPEP